LKEGLKGMIAAYTGKPLIFKEQNRFVQTIFPELSIGMATDYDNIMALLTDYRLGAGYLAFAPRGIPAEDDEKMQSYVVLLQNVNDLFRAEGGGAFVGVHFGGSHICFDYIVFDNKLFKKTMKKAAPLFEKYGAKWVELEADRLAVWEISFKPHILEYAPILKRDEGMLN
jgi:hypothetical protein